MFLILSYKDVKEFYSAAILFKGPVRSDQLQNVHCALNTPDSSAFYQSRVHWCAAKISNRVG